MELTRETNCVCGHTMDDHHVSWIRGHDNPLVEECEFYGWGDYGGLKPDKEFDKWMPHCNYFRPCDCGCNG